MRYDACIRVHMDNNLHDFERVFEDAKKATFSSDERESIKTRIRLFMEAHPPRIPWYIRFADGTVSTYHAADSRKIFGFSVQRIRLAHHKPISFAFALVLCLGVGTTYASEGALPGDVLYPIKVNVSEKVQGALAVATEDKVHWNATLTTRRLEEAEMLAAQGRLTPTVSAEIESQLNTSAENFNEHIVALAQASSNDAFVADAQSNLEASLDAHANVLRALSDESSEVEAVVAPILSSVRAQEVRTKEARPKAEATITAQSNDRVRTVAREKKRIAEDKIKAIHTAAVQVQKPTNSKIDADQPAVTLMAAKVGVSIEVSTSTLPVEDIEISDAERALDEADKKLDAGEYGKAFETYQAAIRAADVTRLGLDATARLQDEKHGTGNE